MDTSHRRLLAIGHGGQGFGFGRVLHSLLSVLAEFAIIKQFELSNAAKSDPTWPVEYKFRCGDMLGLDQIGRIIAEFQPDAILIVKDLWYLPIYANCIRKFTTAPIVAYTPIDGRLNMHPYVENLSGIDRLILYNQFAVNALEDVWNKCEAVAGKQIVRPPVDILPHGTDVTCFAPLAAGSTSMRRQAARSALWPDKPELAEAFIVLNANRNQPRKAIDITIDAFAEFALNKPANVKLCLHMGRTDKGIDIMQRVQDRGLSNRILFTTEGENHPRLSDKQLNQLYNACEVGLNSSLGEGWGLIAFEHGATRAAQVMPRHSACEELWVDAGLLVNTDYDVDFGFITGRRAMQTDITDALQQLYMDPKLLVHMSNVAFDNATKRHLSWRQVGQKLTILIEDAIRQNRSAQVQLSK